MVKRPVPWGDLSLQKFNHSIAASLDTTYNKGKDGLCEKGQTKKDEPYNGKNV